MAVDPVCGMTVNPDRAAGSVEYDGTTYYFCSKSCVAKFQADPKKYLSGVREPMHAPQVLTIGGLKKGPGGEPAFAPRQAQAGGARQDWTCPMDPEVVSDRPGPCPKCGMALEPMLDDISIGDLDKPNPELADMTRRFWIGLVFATPVFLLTMADMATGMAVMRRIGPNSLNWIESILSMPVVLWCGAPFFERMWASFVNRSPNMFTLIGIGTGAAFVASAIATAFPGGPFTDTYF